MSENIKAVFFDIDGTLRSFKTKKVSKKTIEALKKLQDKGIKIFISTGRAPLSIDLIEDLKKIDFDGYVTITGQYCYDKFGKVIYEKFLERSEIENFIPYAKKNNIACAFVELGRYYFNLKNSLVDRLQKEIGASDKHFSKILPIEEALDNKIYQFNTFTTLEEELEILKLMPNSKSARWLDYCNDIIPKDGGKDNGIKNVIAHYNIKQSETMSFGDGGNDIDMLKFTHIGVAMGNAKDDVKKEADFVTKSVDDEGIEYALKHFGLID